MEMFWIIEQMVFSSLRKQDLCISERMLTTNNKLFSNLNYECQLNNKNKIYSF